MVKMGCFANFFLSLLLLLPCRLIYASKAKSAVLQEIGENENSTGWNVLAVVCGWEN